MAATWEPITALGTAFATVITLFGFGIKQARNRGAQEEWKREISKEVGNMNVILAAHTADLAQHEGSFKVIDNKLDNIIDRMDRAERRP
ncbi:MAG: hypothetical protein IMZ69_07335 [Spirochaetes bacterium]|nr:hypothetical protein [Spirochaetota bacterium]